VCVCVYIYIYIYFDHHAFQFSIREELWIIQNKKNLLQNHGQHRNEQTNRFMKTISIEEYHTDTPSLSLTNIDDTIHYIDSKEQYILVHDTLISLVVSWKVTISTSLSSLFHLFCVFLLVFAVWTLSCECSWDSLREISLALAFHAHQNIHTVGPPVGT